MRFRPNESKIEKFSAKSAKANAKILKARKKLKYNKWAEKAFKANAMSEKARNRIARNERLRDMYSKTIDALDSGAITQGKMFMRYVYE
jgi:hypothetical protein